MTARGMADASRPFDAADYLDTAADQADLLSDAVDSGDPRYIAYALGAVARARGALRPGSGQAGARSRHDRQALHKALSEDGNPTLETVLKVLKALGLQMRIEAAEAA